MAKSSETCSGPALGSQHALGVFSTGLSSFLSLAGLHWLWIRQTWIGTSPSPCINFVSSGKINLPKPLFPICKIGMIVLPNSRVIVRIQRQVVKGVAWCLEWVMIQFPKGSCCHLFAGDSASAPSQEFGLANPALSGFGWGTRKEREAGKGRCRWEKPFSLFKYLFHAAPEPSKTDGGWSWVTPAGFSEVGQGHQTLGFLPAGGSASLASLLVVFCACSLLTHSEPSDSDQPVFLAFFWWCKCFTPYLQPSRRTERISAAKSTSGNCFCEVLWGANHLTFIWIALTYHLITPEDFLLPWQEEEGDSSDKTKT